MVFLTSETHGCKEILNILDVHELQSLVETVTRKKGKVTSKTEVINAIIMRSQSPIQLLKRKKIRKDTLFHYLESKEVTVAQTTDKSGLIRIILQHWGSKIDEEYLRLEDEDDTSSSSQASLESSSSSQTSASNTYQHDIMYHRHSSFESRRGQEDDLAQMLTELQHQPFNFDSSLNKPELQILGERFCKWFYEEMNSFNPTKEQKPADFGPQHFWSDAFLLLSTTEISEQRFEGAILTAQRFVAFAKEELLVFNPNISPEGMLVKSDPYGMVMILVCGTIHRDHSCLGTFQQLFAIIKDPRFENNWKIKKTKLNVKSSSVGRA